MFNFKKFKSRYDSLIKETLQSNKPILIESFVEYYGESYRKVIEKKYNEITFVYYINWEMIEFIVDKFIPTVQNPDKYIDFINLNQYYQKQKNKSHSLSKFMKYKDDLPFNFVGITNPLILKNQQIKEKIIKWTTYISPVNVLYGNNDLSERIISFPILQLSEKNIIHEINHALTAEVAFLLVETNQNIEEFTKRGLSNDFLSKSKEAILEELINDKSSEEITKIFKRRGGNLSSFCFNIPLSNTYKFNFYLINQFYEIFKNYLKIARISENKNAIIDRVGTENYNNYVDLVNSLYTVDISQAESNEKENSSKIKSLINEMDHYSKNLKDISQQDLNKYYEQLQDQGYQVEILNNMDISNSQLLTEEDKNLRTK